MANVGPWRPMRTHGDWIVVRDDISRWSAQPSVALKDGKPLTFWNEKSAQLKADALNRRHRP